VIYESKVCLGGGIIDRASGSVDLASGNGT
jgi:hypothetical protein